MKRVAPPSGVTPPRSAKRADGGEVDLEPWARELCDRYFDTYPDHIEHYGPAGDEWCVHDSLYIFSWAIADHDWSDVDLTEQTAWLARVLTARDFPLDRFIRHIELAAAVARDRGDAGLAHRLDEAAAQLRT